MAEQALYRKYALLRLIYQWMDYHGESEFILMVVNIQKSEEWIFWMWLVGQGGHAQYLQNYLNILGLDITLKCWNCPKKFLNGIHSGNMRKIDLQQRFDTIICLFSAINYHNTLDELKKTFKRFYGHLKHGGVLIFDLGFCTENWEEGRVFVDAVVEGDLQLARISQSRLYNGVFDANFLFLIKEDGKIDFEIDKHQIGVFSTHDVQKTLENLGFKCLVYGGYQEQSWDEDANERPVFVCFKP